MYFCCRTSNHSRSKLCGSWSPIVLLLVEVVYRFHSMHYMYYMLLFHSIDQFMHFIGSRYSYRLRDHAIVYNVPGFVCSWSSVCVSVAMKKLVVAS